MNNIGISIEGIGYPISNGGNDEAGVVWALDDNAPDDVSPDTADEYTWRQGMVGPVTPSGVEVDPLTAELTVPSFTAQLHAIRSVTTTLLARQDRPQAELLEGIDKTTTTFDVSFVPTKTDVIYVGAETMLVLTASTITGGAEISVERGYRDSTAERHGIGAGVYTRPPFYRNRLVTLWTHDGATMRRRARGYLSESRVIDGATVLELSVEDPLGALQDVQRLRSQPDLAADGVVTLTEASTPISSEAVRIDTDIAALRADTTIAKQTSDGGLANSTWYLPWVCFGGGVAQTLGLASAYVSNGGPDRHPEFGFQGNVIEVDFDDEGVTDEPVYEVAVWYRGAGGVAPYRIADLEAEVENPWHPVVIAGVLLCSTDSDRADASRLDLLNGQLGLGVDWLFGDVGIQAFIDIGNQDRETQIDQLILGFDGEPVDVFEECVKLMRSAGYYFALRDDGYIEPKRFDLLDVAAFASVDDYRIAWDDRGGSWTWDPGYGAAIQEKTGLLGETPMYDGYSITSLGVGASARIDKMSEAVSTDIDFPFWKNDARGRQYVTAYLERQAIISRSASPTITWRVHDVSIDVGDWVRIRTDDATDGVVFDADGEPKLISELPTVWLTVLVVGRAPADDFNGYALTGRAYMYDQSLGRFRAPSAEVSAWDGINDVITVATTSAFGSDQTDENGFTVGQQVQLYDANLELRSSTVETITAIGVRTIVLSGDFGVTPAVGDILELATYDNYTFTDFGSERGYCYLADANDELGTADDIADEWQ